jgi:hypothetical protein
MRLSRTHPTNADTAVAPDDELAIVRLRGGSAKLGGSGARALLALFCLAFALAIVLVAKSRGHGAIAADSSLNGAWELTQSASSPAGADASSPIVSQRAWIRDGAIHGETRIRTDTEAATISMPFPDRSVTSVTTSPDGRIVTVCWDGRIEITQRGRIRLRIGRSSRDIRGGLTGASLALDGDLILTYPSPARYTRVESAP